MPKPVRFILRFLLIALATLLLLEVLLQVAFTQLPEPLITRMPQYRQRAGFQLDTDHGAREYPAGQNVDFEVTAHTGDLFKLTCLSPAEAPPSEPYRVSYKRDQHGFRNAEPWSDDIELAIIGDSFVAAESIARPFWQDIGETTLALGLPGSGTLEQARLFHAFVQRRQPERVVLAFFAGNDLTDSQRFIEMQRAGKSFAQLDHDGRQVWEYSIIFHLLLSARDAISRLSTSDCHYPLIATTTPPQPVVFYDEFLAMLARDKETLLASEAFQLTRASISEMANATMASGGRFALLYIPQKAELYWSYLSESSKAQLAGGLTAAGQDFSFEGADVNLTVQRDLLRELALELDIVFIDMSAPLAKAIENGGSPYFFSDTHWNQLGHDTARIALLEYMVGTTLDE